MKRKVLSIVLGAFALLLAGCWQKSLHPFYTNADVIFDETLLGQWLDGDDENATEGTTWTFSRAEATNVFLIKIADKETKEEFDGRLFKLGPDRLLDLHSRRRSVGDIPGHTLFRVVEVGTTLKMELLQPDWVQTWVQQRPGDIAHIRVKDPEKPNDADAFEIVLTAETERLQKFLRDHRNDENFWGDEATLKRVKLL